MSVPEGLLPGKGQDSAEAQACVRSDQSPSLWAWLLDVQACVALEILLSHVSGGELTQVRCRQALTSGGFFVPFRGWQSSVKVKGMGFGVGQTWLRVLALPLLSA